MTDEKDDDKKETALAPRVEQPPPSAVETLSKLGPDFLAIAKQQHDLQHHHLEVQERRFTKEIEARENENERRHERFLAEHTSRDNAALRNYRLVSGVGLLIVGVEVFLLASGDVKNAMWLLGVVVAHVTGWIAGLNWKRDSQKKAKRDRRIDVSESDEDE